jgi:hypothetical protein
MPQRGVRKGGGLDLSVILPLVRSRGFERECLASWLDQQTLPRSRYQVILVCIAPLTTPQKEALSKLLPQDALLIRTPAGLHELFCAGARAAQGDVLLFTELSSIAADDCLERLLHWMDQTGHAGGCLGVHHRNPTAAAELEAQRFDREYAQRCRPDDWRKVLCRGFAIERAAYESVGGFDSSLELFADAHLAARLHSVGESFGHAASARVLHINPRSLREAVDDVAAEVRGACLHRARDGDALRAYFPALPSLELRGSLGLARLRCGFGSTLERLKAYEAYRGLVAATARREWVHKHPTPLATPAVEPQRRAA